MLRDNKLLTTPSLSNFKNLTLVDVSFNKLTSLKGMSEVSSTLKELYVSKNEVGKIEEIEHLRSLRVLELGSNKIRVCGTNLSKLVVEVLVRSLIWNHQG